MPVYVFECEQCSACTEFNWLISEYDEKIKKGKCFKCKSKKIYRKYDHDNVYTKVVDIKTVGQLADVNTKKYKSKLDEEAAKKNEESKIEKPWYHSSNAPSTKEINKMTKEQKKKYIIEGKK